MSDYSNQPNQQQMPNQNQQQSLGKGNSPKETLWDGSIKAAIFENQLENGVSYSVEPGRIYTDAQNQIREAKSFSGSEALRVSRLIQKAYDRIGEFKQQAKGQNISQGRER